MGINKKIIIPLVAAIVLAASYVGYLQYEARKKQQEQQQAQIDINILKNKVVNAMKSRDYPKVYQLIIDKLQKNENVGNSTVKAVDQEVYKLIDNKEYKEIIKFYSFGEHKVFNINEEMRNKIIATNNEELIHFSLEYLYGLYEKKEPFFLKEWQGLILRKFYYLAISLGDIPMIEKAKDRVYKQDDRYYINQPGIEESVVRYGKLKALKYAIKSGLINFDAKMKAKLISKYVQSYPISKEALIFVLDDIKQTGWTNFDKWDLENINDGLIRQRISKSIYGKETFQLLRDYGFVKKLESYKNKTITNFDDFNYDIFLFYAWLGEHELFEEYLNEIPLPLINLDGFKSFGSDFKYPAKIFAFTNDMEGVNILTKYGYSFSENDTVTTRYIKVAGRMGSIDVARYYIEQTSHFNFNDYDNYISITKYDKNNPKHKSYILYLIDHFDASYGGLDNIYIEKLAYYNDKDILLAAFDKGIEFDKSKFDSLNESESNRYSQEIKDLIRKKKEELKLRKEQSSKSDEFNRTSKHKSDVKPEKVSLAVSLYNRGIATYEKQPDYSPMNLNKEDNASTDLFRRSAELGYDKAQFMLARSYGGLLGNTFENINKGLYWYKKSAIQGNLNAQISLGMTYNSLDENIKKSDYRIQSYMWYEIAKHNPNNKNKSDFNYLVSLRMTPKEIKMAKESAKECHDTNYQQCYGVEYDNFNHID